MGLGHWVAGIFQLGVIDPLQGTFLFPRKSAGNIIPGVSFFSQSREMPFLF